MLRGQLRKGAETLRESIEAAWERAVMTALEAGDREALERLQSVAMDRMLLERVRV